MSPKLIIAPSESSTRSSPIHTSFATPSPPATVNAAVPVALASVVSVKVTTPLVNATVPVAFGNVMVRSAVGPVTVKVVSYSSLVAPSKTIVPSSATLTVVAVEVVAEIAVKIAVPDSKPVTSVTRLLNSPLSCSRVFAVVISDAVIAITVYPL